MNQKNNDSEKREYRRVPNQASIEICRLSFPIVFKTEGVGRNKDISDGGICFRYPEPLKPGQVLALKIDLRGWEVHKKPHSLFVDIASEKPFTAIGEVVWCGDFEEGAGFEVGIKFTGVDKDDQRALARYLSQSVR